MVFLVSAGYLFLLYVCRRTGNLFDAGLLGALVLGFVLTGIPSDSPLEEAFARKVEAAASAPPFGSIGNLSLPLFQQFLVPFELVSLLIAVAILGVVVLAKKKL